MEKEEKTSENKKDETTEVKKVECPNCGSDYIVINGRCITCYSCGSGTCSL